MPSRSSAIAYSLATAFIAAMVTLAGCPATPAAPPAEAAATFDSVQRHVFTNCSTSTCHGSGARGSLQLTPEVAYDQLVGVPAAHAGAKAKGKVRVKAGDPDGSFLVQKLEGPAADEGGTMPPRGKLPPETIALVRRWIAAGCPR